MGNRVSLEENLIELRIVSKQVSDVVWNGMACLELNRVPTDCRLRELAVHSYVGSRGMPPTPLLNRNVTHTLQQYEGL